MEHLDKHIQEINLRIISYTGDSVKSNYKQVVLLSNYIDVLIAVLQYMQYFTSIELDELWMQFGTGKSR